MRQLAAGIAVLGMGLGVAACAATEKKYQDEAADYIESEEVADEVGQAFTGAECVTPASTDVGTSFTCTATGADGVAYSFDVEITAKSEFTVAGPNPAG